jgi:hypothetical protein
MNHALVRALLLAAAWTRSGAPVPLPAQPAGAGDSAYVARHYAKRELRIPMRDGVRLFTVAYVPRDASPGRRYPIVLQRTPFSAGPYGAGAYAKTPGPDPYMLRDGYIFVTQEVRGRYLSEGTFENVRPLLPDSARKSAPGATDEATDAFDTIEWLVANVAESEGRVGLFGISYGGFYAAAAALSRHPAVAAASLQAPVMDLYFEDFHHNGALLQAHLAAYPVFGTPRPAPAAAHWWLPEYLRVAGRLEGGDHALLALGPLRNVTADLLAGNEWWSAVAAHPDYDEFWRARALPARLRGITAPVLVVGGWFDAENLYGTLAAYRALRERSPAADVTLAMGPFGHRGWAGQDAPHTVHGDLHFGDSLAAAFQRGVEAPFFRQHLKRGPGGAPAGAWMFDTGRKGWTRFDRWPAPAARPRTFFLRADGSLGDAPVAGRTPFVEYAGDPLRPVPARCAGPTVEEGRLDRVMSDDQRCFAGRPDVATFQTGPLPSDVTLAGELAAHLVVSTSGTDADFVVKVIDVYPPDEPNTAYTPDSVRLAGYHQLVRGEIMRGRYRRSFSAPEPFRPHEAAEVAVPMPDVFHTFRAGHRIMVQVQGSWFPLFDRNPQRYVPSIFQADAADFVRAAHRIWTGPERASRLDALVLPPPGRR